MRVLRGRAETIEKDRLRTRELLETAGEEREHTLRVWTPHRQLAFGRRDANGSGYEDARRIADEQGFPPLARSVGGRAVAYTETTLAFAHAIPIEDLRRGMDARYDEAAGRIRRALSELGVEAEHGEPPESFCPGAHSLSSEGKIVGIAQRITQKAALVSGIVLVADHEEIARVLEPVYDALAIPFDPGSVGSVARTGGPADPEQVALTIESAFTSDHETRIERIDT
jgi:octanoyl-[GcvH]:protein N-octanoyltransferase